MAELNIPDSEDALVERLKSLHKRRKSFARPKRRLHLDVCERRTVFKKTAGRCHLCGGALKERAFAADHILSHAAGGEANTDNFLPAHAICNGSRWFYSDEEFKWILRMGVWARKQIEDSTEIGKRMVPKFLAHEQKKVKRRKSKKERFKLPAND